MFTIICTLILYFRAHLIVAKKKRPKKLGFLQKSSYRFIIYSKVSNFEVYKGGDIDVCR